MIFTTIPHDIIVSVGKNWEIGEKGGLAIQNKDDMKFFREMTMKRCIIMGRKTAESLPNKKPLEGRLNIVVSKQPVRSNDLIKNGFIVKDSIEKALLFYEFYASKLDLLTDRIMFIGGASIYRQVLPTCRYAFVTHNSTENPHADTYFPVEELYLHHDLILRSEKRTTSGLPPHQFFVYQNKHINVTN